MYDQTHEEATFMNCVGISSHHQTHKIVIITLINDNANGTMGRNMKQLACIAVLHDERPKSNQPINYLSACYWLALAERDQYSFTSFPNSDPSLFISLIGSSYSTTLPVSVNLENEHLTSNQIINKQKSIPFMVGTYHH